jgi:hypothetical protein
MMLFDYPIVESIILIIVLAYSFSDNHRKKKPLFNINRYVILFIITYIIIMVKYFNNVA